MAISGCFGWKNKSFQLTHVNSVEVRLDEDRKQSESALEQNLQSSEKQAVETELESKRHEAAVKSNCLDKKSKQRLANLLLAITCISFLLALVLLIYFTTKNDVVVAAVKCDTNDDLPEHRKCRNGVVTRNDGSRCSLFEFGLYEGIYQPECAKGTKTSTNRTVPPFKGMLAANSFFFPAQTRFAGLAAEYDLPQDFVNCGLYFESSALQDALRYAAQEANRTETEFASEFFGIFFPLSNETTLEVILNTSIQYCKTDEDNLMHLINAQIWTPVTLILLAIGSLSNILMWLYLVTGSRQQKAKEEFELTIDQEHPGRIVETKAACGWADICIGCTFLTILILVLSCWIASTIFVFDNGYLQDDRWMANLVSRSETVTESGLVVTADPFQASIIDPIAKSIIVVTLVILFPSHWIR